jgi:drug/metabolite transporter (DMT)-like permease
MVLELSVFAAFGAMLCWGLGDFFIQRCTREEGDIEALAFIGIIGAVILLPLVVPDLHLLASPANLALLFTIGLVTLIAALLDFEALKEGKLSVIETVFEIELPATVILGLVFFGETVSTMQAALILLVLAGIGMISLESLSKRHYMKRFERGILLGALGALAMAFLNFSTAAGARMVSPVMAVWVPYLVFTALCLFFIWRREGFRKLAENALSHKFNILGMGVFDTLAWVLFAFAVAKNELAITTAITGAYPAIALILAIAVNREKILRHQYAGAAIALCAGILLGLAV